MKLFLYENNDNYKQLEFYLYCLLERLRIFYLIYHLRPPRRDNCKLRHSACKFIYNVGKHKIFQ